jgi:hypothetical protein
MYASWMPHQADSMKLVGRGKLTTRLFEVQSRQQNEALDHSRRTVLLQNSEPMSVISSFEVSVADSMPRFLDIRINWRKTNCEFAVPPAIRFQHMKHRGSKWNASEQGGHCV